MDGTEAAVAFDQSLAVVGRNGTLNKPDARHLRAGPLPGQDRHAAATSRALAGFCDTTGGERVAFAFLMNGVWPAVGPRAAGPDDGRAGSLRRIRVSP